MSGVGNSENVERRRLAFTALRTLATAAALGLVYFVAPIDLREHASVIGRLSAGFALFVAALAYEVRAILRSRFPIHRAAVAMALIFPLFIVVFAWTYLTMSRSAPAAFGEQFSRITALYFTVTVFSTVGFGDITPKTDPARLVVMLQMLGDVVVIAVVFRLLLGAARGAFGLSTPANAPEPPKGIDEHI